MCRPAHRWYHGKPAAGPRLKIEYQLSRPIFLRLVGEYTTERQDALRDDTRTGRPILIYDPGAGTYVRATPSAGDPSAAIFCFPTSPPRNGPLCRLRQHPGDPTELGRSRLRRLEDGFFLKLSYLFQM